MLQLDRLPSTDSSCGLFVACFMKLSLNYFSCFNILAALICSSEGLCCADLVVTVMTCLGGRWRQTAQWTPTTLSRTRIVSVRSVSTHSGLNHMKKQTVQTNDVGQSACL